VQWRTKVTDLRRSLGPGVPGGLSAGGCRQTGNQYYAQIKNQEEMAIEGAHRSRASLYHLGRRRTPEGDEKEKATKHGAHEQRLP
jgi:hypothetical protein